MSEKEEITETKIENQTGEKAEKQTGNQTEEKQETFWEEAWDFIKTLLISMAVVFLLSQFVVRPIRVKGSSMYPTLESNSLGIANVYSVRANNIQRFDIAIIYLSDKKEYLVKRVIGLPGETVQYSDGTLYIDGTAVNEPFFDEEYVKSFGNGFMSDVAPVTLGTDEYYCLGDNRPASRDSRYYGPFRRETILAKGAFIFFPFRNFGVKSW